jgi:hypothetical protein
MTKVGQKFTALTGEDKELLELAAKAAQLQLKYSSSAGFSEYGDMKPWDPLADDGDALRLAVKLKLSISIGPGSVCVSSPGYSIVDDTSKDALAATRRAIVRAAAEIGRSAG